MTEPVQTWDPQRIASAHVDRLGELLAKLDLTAFGRVANCLRRARDEGATVYVAGNGGSAATAMHWVNDLGKATKRAGRGPIRVMGLCDNVSWLTALANDEGYDRIFEGQMENFARSGDVFVAISASGNSPNLVRAAAWARGRGVTAIGLVGFDGGKLRPLVDDALWIPTEKGAYELVEDVHHVLCHMLTICLVEDVVSGTRPRA